MRTADYIDLLTGTAKAIGVNIEQASGDEFATLRTLHSDRLATAWEHHYWPELIETEKRYFRLLWNSATAYSAPSVSAAQEVYYPGPGKYYQTLKASTNQAPATYSANVWTTNDTYWAECQASYNAAQYDASTAYTRGDQVYYPTTDRYYQLHAASSTGNAPTDATYWGVLTPFDQYVAYEQTGETAFEHAFSAWDKDPQNFKDARRIRHGFSPNGVQIWERVGFVWLKLRRRCPVLTGDLLVTTATYAADAQAYYESATTRGNFYDCVTATNAGETPDSHPAKWALVEIPLAFRRYLIHGAAADYLEPEEESDGVNRQHALAEDALSRAVNLVFGQCGQEQEVEFMTR